MDVAGREDFLDLVRSALLAALEALPATVLFGLISFANKISLHDVQGAGSSKRMLETPLMDSLVPYNPNRETMCDEGMCICDLNLPVNAALAMGVCFTKHGVTSVMGLVHLVWSVSVHVCLMSKHMQPTALRQQHAMHIRVANSYCAGLTTLHCIIISIISIM